MIVFRSGHGFSKSGSGKSGCSRKSYPNQAIRKAARLPISIFGDAYVEAIPDKELKQLAKREARETHGQIHGQATIVTVLGARPGTKAVGRFGWKDQAANLLSFSADAMRHELGIPNQYFPAPNRVMDGVKSKMGYNPRTDAQLAAIVQFLHTLQPIPPDPVQSATPAAREGAKLFQQIGCSICHVETLTTAPPGTKMYGGTLVVSKQIGGKVIHPYSDFLLHNVGTGDGIAENLRPQDYDSRTLEKFRTPPLWGLRYRRWMMHDGKAVSYDQAILRHGGEATEVVRRYKKLTPIQRQDLMEFLNSL